MRLNPQKVYARWGRKHGRQETQEQKSMIKHTATIEHVIILYNQYNEQFWCVSYMEVSILFYAKATSIIRSVKTPE